MQNIYVYIPETYHGASFLFYYGITSVFTFHTRCISVVRSLYFFVTFLSPEIGEMRSVFSILVSGTELRRVLGDAHFQNENSFALGTTKFCIQNVHSTTNQKSKI